ncbi:MAG TPA: gamma-glutamyltransferase [Pirellulales bacterium]|nr:gamma-glutamyltransferase [Pirellulales bacterium]
MQRRWIAWILCCSVEMLNAASLSSNRAAGHDRPSGELRQSRSRVVAQHGMVATSQPLAVQAGLDVLKRGGNAADAAVAAGAVLGVVEPMSCGVGGDLFVLYWDAKSKKLFGLNACGRSPYDLSREVFQAKGLREIPDEGPLSWSVPGCVSGWEDLLRRFGTQPLAALLQPAIGCAEQGFPVSEIIASDWQSAQERLARWPDSATTYLPGGEAPAVGQVFRNPRLAATYRAVAAGGAEAFYRGDIARQIVEFSRSNGGFFSVRDFAEHRNDWIEPVSTTYRGHTVWELPPNGQGIAVLEMLNLLEAYELASLGPGNPEYLHLLVEAKKLAFADRAKFYSDPAFTQLPVAHLISKPYAQTRRQWIDRRRAATDVPPGDARLAHGDTIYLSVVDKDRNCCSYIQSNYYGFGSMVVPGELGFALQNRGTLFALDDEHLNRYEPHKRPFHTIIPALVTKDEKPVFVFGVMGGDMQPQGHVQVLINLIDFKLNVQAAGDAARVRHSGSATPTGLPAEAGGGTVFVESGVSDEAIEALRSKGHQVVRARSGYGGYQGVWIDWQQGVLHGASDPRKDGCAAGY